MSICRFLLVSGLCAFVAGCGGADKTTKTDTAASANAAKSATTTHEAKHQASPDVIALLQDMYRDSSANAINDVASVPGYSDDQAWTTDLNTDAYGPELRIYTGPNARKMTEIDTGVSIAVIEVLGATTGMNSYTRLGIDHADAVKQYCVFLSSGAAHAAIVPSQSQKCVKPSSYPLMVVARPSAGSQADYPASVRIAEYDGSYPYFQVPCGNTQCDIGVQVPGTEPTPAVDQLPPAGNGEKIKTRHDEQRIAEMDGTNKPLRRSNVRASIIPVANLESLPHSAYTTQKQGKLIGTKVGRIVLKADAPAGDKYSKWGLAKGANWIWIRMNGANYEAQFVHGGGDPDQNGTWFDARRETHQYVKVPGTARWIWDANDEGAWISCDQGCCDISQGPPSKGGTGNPPGNPGPGNQPPGPKKP